MDYENYLRQGLALQGFPFYETDIPYIHRVLSTINQAQAPLKEFPTLNKEIPLTIVDKGVLKG